MDYGLLDPTRWQAMLEREGAPVSTAAIGLLRREEYLARRGTMLLWRPAGAGCRTELCEYSGAPAADVAVLLVAEEAAVRILLEGGWSRLAALVRQGRVHPYLLKGAEELEAAGLADFIEDLGLVFPRH